MGQVSPEQHLILLVDDREDDRFTVKRAMSKARMVNPVQEAGSGEEAIAYLRGEGKFSKREEFPCRN